MQTLIQVIIVALVTIWNRNTMNYYIFLHTKCPRIKYVPWFWEGRINIFFQNNNDYIEKGQS